MSSVLDPLRMSLRSVHSINASAGTGKTFTITTLYLRYLLEARCSVDQILVTTFTEAATAELKDRLRQRLAQAFWLLREHETVEELDAAVEAGRGDQQVATLLKNIGALEANSRMRVLERLEDAMLSFDQAPVFTIHGFCNQVLQQLVFETGSRFQFELLTTQEPLVDEAVHDFVARYWTDPRSSMAQWLPLKPDLWKQLKEVARVAAEHPADRVVPENASGNVLPQADEFALFDQRAAEFIQLWCSCREEVEAVLAVAVRDDVLSKSAHKPDQLAEAIRFWDEFTQNPSPFEFKWDETGKLSSLHARLTQSRLIDATKKAKAGHEPKHRCFEMYEDVVDLAFGIAQKAEQIRIAMMSRLADFVRRQVAQHKDQHGTLTFSDMLHLVDEALSRPDRQSLKVSLRERYRVAMVDEFQDTDPVQFRIFSRIFLEDADDRQISGSDRHAQDGAEHSSPPLRSDSVSTEPDDIADDFDPFGDVSSFYEDIPNEPPQFDDENEAVRDGVSMESENFRAFVMIGDPKQSIYKFRGADLNAYLRAIKEVPENQRHQMDCNWRSDDSLVRAVQGFFRSTANPFLRDEIDLPTVTAAHPDRFTAGPAFEIRVVPRSEDEQAKPLNKDAALSRVLSEVAADIVRKINSQLMVPDGTEQRAAMPGDFAVLGRTRQQLIAMQQALAERGIPAVLHVDESVYGSGEALEVSQMLQAILQATGGRHLATALRTSFGGRVASEIEQILHDDQALAEWSEKLREWKAIWQHEGFIVMWRRLLDELHVVPRLAGMMGGERQITNLLHLGELLHDHAVQQHAGPEELLRWFEQMRSDDDTANEAAQLRLETDSESVQLITIHKSKGLEYPIVYCPVLWAERDADKDKKKVLVLSSRQGVDRVELEVPEIDVGSELLPDRREWDAEEQHAEQRRLLYVALTRARHQCVVHWIAGRDMSKSAASAFLCPDWDEKSCDEALSQSLIQWAASLEIPRVSVVSASEIAALDDPGASQWAAGDHGIFECRPILRDELPVKWQTSYSALVRMLPVHAQQEWADRDELVSETETIASASVAGERVPLAEMPGGTRVGDVVHRVLESVLLRRPEPKLLTTVMEQGLAREMRRAALDQRWLGPLAATLVATLNAPLKEFEPEARLLDVPPSDVACELPFVLRLGRGRETGSQSRNRSSSRGNGDTDGNLSADDISDTDQSVGLSKLAECFTQARQPFVRNYAERVRGLDQGRLNGLLVGFIDVVFCWQGRWYVIDYKTTNLGPRFSDYTPERLAGAMAEHDYILQYHLYVVALSQFLKQRQPDFDIERDFGGVLYLFLRGIDPRAKHLGGVFFDRPEPELIESLGKVLNGCGKLPSTTSDP